MTERSIHPSIGNVRQKETCKKGAACCWMNEEGRGGGDNKKNWKLTAVERRDSDRKRNTPMIIGPCRKWGFPRRLTNLAKSFRNKAITESKNLCLFDVAGQQCQLSPVGDSTQFKQLQDSTTAAAATLCSHTHTRLVYLFGSLFSLWT